jgi:ribosomal protein S18 acetylase RimI-like enzyme
MNAPVGSNLNAGLPPVSLRPEQPEDEGFLFEVYASTRLEELALTNWNEATRRAFLSQQFNAMREGYRTMFPAGEFSIILLENRRAGRMVIHHDATEIRVVDIALLPADQNRGIGTWLMRQVCTVAANAGKPVRLCVLKNNRALRWYARLGFSPAGERGIYDELEWCPAGPPAKGAMRNSPTG